MAPSNTTAATQGTKRKANNTGSASNPKFAKIDLVRTALEGSEYEDCLQLPAPVLAMLADASKEVLKDPAGKRFPFQQRIAGMIHDALTHVRAGLDGKFEEKQGLLDAANATREKFETARAAAKEVLDARKADLEAKREARGAAEEVRSAKVAARDEADKAKAEAEQARKDILSEQEQNAKILEDFKGLETQEEPAPKDSETKKVLAPVQKLLKKRALEACLLEALPAAVRLAPAARGDFDRMCIEKVAETFQAMELEAQADLAGAAEKIQALEQDMVRMAGELEAADATLAKAADVLEEADAERENAQAALGEAQAAVRKHDKEAKQTVLAAKSACSRREVFENVEEAFRVLGDPSSEKTSSEEHNTTADNMGEIECNA